MHILCRIQILDSATNFFDLKILAFYYRLLAFAIVALYGIVSRLLSTGTVLVATNNRAPTFLNQLCRKLDCLKYLGLLSHAIPLFCCC